MIQHTEYRDNGAIGALLDEYEKALLEMVYVIQNISNENLTKIADHNTQDADCVSIQSVLSHVVSAGNNYTIAIRKWKGESLEYTRPRHLDNASLYIEALNDLMNKNIALFNTYPNIKVEEHDPSKKINVSWGQQYDVDQLMEHAIVHILRHRRQIERFLLKDN